MMSSKQILNTGLLLLAVLFSVGLMFAFMELPVWLDRLAQSFIHTPQTDPANDQARIEIFYQASAIRTIGYSSLVIILALIVIGFVTGRSGWSMAGSIALFLPVFATFAYSMFYLAGLGLFNVIILPLMDVSLSLIDLGKVVLVPYWVLMWLGGLAGLNLHDFLLYLFMGSGAFIFVLGVFAWLRTRYENRKVAKHWIYRFSRHPQYLGWIIWSYGLMLYGPSLNIMKKSWGWVGTLPWLLSVMIIIGICMLEELKMSRTAGEDYNGYRNRTPFLFPLPRFIVDFFNAPLRIITGRKRPEKRSDVALVISLYTLVFIALSLFWVDLTPGTEGIDRVGLTYSKERADSLVKVITTPVERRYRSKEPYNLMISMGSDAYPEYLKLIQHPEPEVREFAIDAASQHSVREAIPLMINALYDSVPRVVNSAVRGLGTMKVYEATDTLFWMVPNPIIQANQDLLLSTLAGMGDRRVMPYLESRLKSDLWYHRTAALRAMSELDSIASLPYVYTALEDEDPHLRVEAVNILLFQLPGDAIPHLQKVVHDPVWEVRFYAKQALKRIRAE